MMSNNRRDRSRSPNRGGSLGRRRDNRDRNHSREDSKDSDMSNSMMNQQMMNMYQNQQGNMMMGGGMYPNMMMQNAMMGGTVMAGTGMDMMGTGAMDMMSQAPMDIASMGGLPAGGSANMDMSMMGGMMMDPSMMGDMSMYQNMQGGNMANMGMEIEKKEIILKNCILSPPSEGSTEPPRRIKPPGCRTIFVGGLPDNIRESVVREIFENYGRIKILRLSTKNFCHIRFEREDSVDAAMHISGYQLKLISKTNNKEEENSKANTGYLHVDYALSRDDQNEHERRQRQVMRAQEAQLMTLSAQQQALARTNMAMYRSSPSPVKTLPFSHGAMMQLIEKMKKDEHFRNSLPTLISWLERGECSKKNATQFYCMIQVTNSHIRRLFNEKVQAEDELNECKERVKNYIECLIEQLEQVAKVFSAAIHQRVWDHFTKAQRKNIETWQKMSQEFLNLKEEFNEKFYNDDIERNNGFNQPTLDNEEFSETKQLKLENDSLRFQLEAYKNEIEVIKADAKKETEKFKAQFIARQALQNFDNNKQAPQPPPPSAPPVQPAPPPAPAAGPDAAVADSVLAACGEARLIGVMAAFLQVHPQGASLDYVVSYVRSLGGPRASHAEIHRVLQKHSDAFVCTTTGVGANIEHRWAFIGFQPPLPAPSSTPPGAPQA